MVRFLPLPLPLVSKKNSRIQSPSPAKLPKASIIHIYPPYFISPRLGRLFPFTSRYDIFPSTNTHPPVDVQFDLLSLRPDTNAPLTSFLLYSLNVFTKIGFVGLWERMWESGKMGEWVVVNQDEEGEEGAEEGGTSEGM